MAGVRNPMIRLLSYSPTVGFQVVVHPRASLTVRLPALTEFVRTSAPLVPLSKHPAWLNIFRTSMDHEVFAIEAVAAGQTFGYLPLAFVNSFLFGMNYRLGSPDVTVPPPSPTPWVADPNWRTWGTAQV